MYESFYGFDKRPFPAVADASHYFPIEELEAARESLARVIRDGEGPGVAVGPAGVGKSLLCALLEKTFKNDFHVVTLACGQLRELKDMLQCIVHQLRLPHKGQNEGELRLTLLDFLEPSDECPNGLLLLVDEAQHLSLELLEEVRMISNFVRNGSPRVRVVLMGNDRLEENFTNPKLESLNQRLAARCYLQGMGREETRQYVAGLTSSAGGGLGLWSEDAFRAIYDASHGIPRVINQVCHRALMMAFESSETMISSGLIQQAWSELQQLPTPWVSDAPASEEGTCVVEFGGLDEDDAPLSEDTSTVESVGPLAEADTAEPAFGDEHSDEQASAAPVVFDVEVNCPDQIVQYDLTEDAKDRGAEVQSRLEEVEMCCGATEPPASRVEHDNVVENPFGEFPEEEVVLEQQVQLGASGRTVGPRVSSMESRLLAETLSGDSADVDAGKVLCEVDVATFTGSLHEPPTSGSHESYEPATVVPIFAATRDDRDIIVIEDEVPANGESRDVFDRLRGSKG